MNISKVIVALDFATQKKALELVDRLDPKMCRLKVGKELFTAAGPALVERLVERGYDVFLDLKFHDIPKTVANACKAAANLGVWMMNVHAIGGRRMMEAAREVLDDISDRPRLIAVTVLTSMGQEELNDLGIPGEPKETVLRLARMAKECRLDGVVCSAQEAMMLRQELGKDFCLVTPGIRSANAAHDDQVRIATPMEAIRLGSDFLVIGRPITKAADPLQVIQQINLELSGEMQ